MLNTNKTTFTSNLYTKTRVLSNEERCIVHMEARRKTRSANGAYGPIIGISVPCPWSYNRDITSVPMVL